MQQKVSVLTLFYLFIVYSWFPTILPFHPYINRPRTGETTPPPEVVRAKQLRSKIAQRGGANNAEDTDVVDQFFDDEREEGDVEQEEQEPEAEQEPYFNPPRVETPTFIRQSSTSSDTMPPSANRVLQPSPIAAPFAAGTTLGPQPLSTATYEVSRRGARSANTQLQINISAMAELMIQQRQLQIEEDRQYRLLREREREEERREAQRLRDEERQRREQEREEDRRRREEEQRRRDEDRRDFMAVMQVALGAYMQSSNRNNSNTNNGGGNNNNNEQN